MRDGTFTKSSKNNKVRNIRQFFTESDKIGELTDNFSLYTEKIHIHEAQTKLNKEVMMIIYKDHLVFIFLETSIFFMRPVNIITDIKKITRCNMDSNSNEFKGF